MVMTAPERSTEHTTPDDRPLPRTPREIFESLPPNPRLRAEIINGNLIVSPSGLPKHGRMAMRLAFALLPVQEEHGWESFTGNVDICVEGPRDTVVPDYCLVPVNAPLWGDREILSSALIMVAEVVSPGSKELDRITKPGLYAGCRIPVMLLIDPVASPPTVTVFSDPEDGDYRTTTRTEMGKPLRLPSPVDFDLDTSIFL
ncbi:hypothetical protein GCM10010517_69910 [Streptosporangium fragile]|uniref:Putative restriction endonuclease domain-containing protein n=2 Tax=Streptosporangium fragile TaxID=46186 RepID=A0ABN3W9U3_9ACTN